MKLRPIHRRSFIRTGALFVPAVLLARKSLGQFGSFNDQAFLAQGATCAAGVTFANAWAARVVTNGGAAPSQASTNLIATLQCGLIADGLDTRMLQWNAFVPDSLIAGITPQLTNKPTFSGNDPWTNHNFVLADLTVNGLTGNASNKFLDTGFVTPGAWNTSFGVVVYNYTATGTGFDYGSYDGTTGVLGAAKHSDGKTYSYSGNTSNNAISLTSPGNGFYSAQRVSTTDHRLYFASSVSPHAQIGTTDVVSEPALPGVNPLHIFEVSLSGASQFPCSNTISFVAFTTGFSAADSAKLYARVQAYLIARGGGFR